MKAASGIAQFVPDSRNRKAAGTYGWGFDVNGFRVVMYGPREWDHPVVKAIEKTLPRRDRQDSDDFEHDTDSTGHVIDAKIDRRELQRQRADMAKGVNIRKEHGPAHIHIIEKKSGRESKFELIENLDPSENHVVLMDGGNRKISLKANEIQAAIPVLRQYSSEFMQLWREFYQDKRLSSYVTRVSEKFPDQLERKFFDAHGQPYIELEDMISKQKAIMRYEDYVAIKPPTSEMRR